MADGASGTGRARATSLLAVVFLIGAVCGAAIWVLAERAIALHRPPPPMTHRPPFERIARHLDLDADQRREVRRILEHSGLRVREALEEAHDEIREILTPEQQERFDRMRARHERTGPRRRRSGRGPLPEPGP